MHKLDEAATVRLTDNHHSANNWSITFTQSKCSSDINHGLWMEDAEIQSKSTPTPLQYSHSLKQCILQFILLIHLDLYCAETLEFIHDPKIYLCSNLWCGYYTAIMKPLGKFNIICLIASQQTVCLPQLKQITVNKWGTMVQSSHPSTMNPLHRGQ